MRKILFFALTVLAVFGSFRPVPVLAGVPPAGTQIAVGAEHTCALTSVGGVKCWGNNDAGQLGTGAAGSAQEEPVDVAGLTSGVTAVVAGKLHTCALLGTGELVCWGYNVYGQLGRGFTSIGTSLGEATPAETTLNTDTFTAVSAGADHTCAVRTAGNLFCWGYNQFGQIGNGTTTSPVVTPYNHGGTWTGLAAGGLHSCGITAGALLRCWGYNAHGQVGVMPPFPPMQPIHTTEQPIPGHTGWTSVSAGGLHTCGIKSSGALLCWGSNLYGQVGNNNPGAVPVTSPVQIAASGYGVTTAGERHSCALTTAGATKCWGANANGQIGDGSTTQRNVPTDVPGLSSGVSAIAAGASHTCALTGNGGARCWGAGLFGQLGDGFAWASTPLSVPGLSDVVAISAGGNHACAAINAGAVKCWGAFAEFDGGFVIRSDGPVDIAGVSSATALASGSDHACALTGSVGVKCWGQGTSGRLGNGSVADSASAVDVTGLTSGMFAIGAGAEHSCAITNLTAAKCWGENGGGRLGNGLTTDSSIPVDVTTFGNASGATSIAGGGSHTCAVVSGGAWCWGADNDGQLGNGAGGASTTPINVTGLGSNVVVMMGGSRHACAVIVAGGQAMCWGDDADGQLGNGAGGASTSPVFVTGVSGAVGGGSGDNHTCVVLNSGAAQCWGRGDWGALGNGGITDATSPVAVSGLTIGADAIDGGTSHTCALVNAGVKCWGSNGSGQLGLGRSAASLVASPVLGTQWGRDSDGDGYPDGQELLLGENPEDACPTMRADVDGDGSVTIADLAAVAGQFLQPIPPGNPRFNQDLDAVITIADLATMAARFLQGVGSCA